MIFHDSAEILVPPIKVWDWLLHFTENYCAWHPAHIRAFWEAGEPNQIGSIICTEEKLLNRSLKISIKIIKFVPEREIEFETVHALKVVVLGGSFRIEPSQTGAIIHITLQIRGGKILSKIAKNVFQAIQEHNREETNNLKQILEKN